MPTRPSKSEITISFGIRGPIFRDRVVDDSTSSPKRAMISSATALRLVTESKKFLPRSSSPSAHGLKIIPETFLGSE